MATTNSQHSHRYNVRVEQSPAQVEEIQEQYYKELTRRTRRLRGVLRTSISENDALELGDPSRRNDDIDPVDDFEFEQSSGKAVAFNNQLQEWLDNGVLERTGDDLVQSGEHYTSVYAESAYEEGLDFANQQLIDAGMQQVPGEDVSLTEQEASAILGRPIHQDTLAQIYTRHYEQLEGVTQAIDTQLSEILTDAIRKGWNPLKTANEINQEVESIERSRALMISRTETLNAHNRAALKRYQESDVTRVEILTHTPCEQCQRIEANDPYRITEGMRIVPAHPNCVCTYAPII